MSTQYVKGFTYNGETTTFNGAVAPVSEVLSALIYSFKTSDFT